MTKVKTPDPSLPELVLVGIIRVFGVKGGAAAKAIAPAVLTLIAALAQSFATGSFDAAELATLVVGLGGAAVTFLVPNLNTIVRKVIAGRIVALGTSPEQRPEDSPTGGLPADEDAVNEPSDVPGL